MYTMIKELAHS